MFVNKPQDMMKEYRKASVNAELAMADPYTITKALFQGVFERLGQAKGAIARGDLEEKAKRLASASAIIQHLKDTLDPSQAPEIAKNLAFIYDFMLAKIADASMQVSAQPIDDALKVFMPIKDAWDSIPQSAIKEAEAKMRANQKHFQHNYDPTKNLVEGAI
ncbi:MAG TPA: flagellar export chaperone FliS [Candidatus Anaerobiospirillum pullistercoris]|uniref:Flagellar secretion chaperone FliS n=1 Tax=Candidatus Anaerobiospirillum pullistercoris TaxID=2838452 RepID=A0A9D1WEV6_9GAMM|nr:flagellar export chaperone FliS [Candidatus Anaerobiospirillum pullistercoris]